MIIQDVSQFSNAASKALNVHGKYLKCASWVPKKKKKKKGTSKQSDSFQFFFSILKDIQIDMLSTGKF